MLCYWHITALRFISSKTFRITYSQPWLWAYASFCCHGYVLRHSTALPRCGIMGKLDKTVTVYVDSELRSWLDEKSDSGYKIGSLVRHILRRQMAFEKGQKPSSVVSA